MPKQNDQNQKPRPSLLHRVLVGEPHPVMQRLLGETPISGASNPDRPVSSVLKLLKGK